MTDQPTMTCDWCRKEFPADARACLEAGIDLYQRPPDGEAWKGTVAPNPNDFTPQDRANIKEQLGLTDAQVEELITTGQVEGLGAIVCLECQEAQH